MSNELVAALIGALVGGLASGVAALGGSVVVNRIQLKKATRLRMYDEILPQVARPFGVLQDQFTTKADPLAPPEFLSLVDNLVVCLRGDLTRRSGRGAWALPSSAAALPSPRIQPLAGVTHRPGSRT